MMMIMGKNANLNILMQGLSIVLGKLGSEQLGLKIHFLGADSWTQGQSVCSPTVWGPIFHGPNLPRASTVQKAQTAHPFDARLADFPVKMMMKGQLKYTTRIFSA